MLNFGLSGGHKRRVACDEDFRAGMNRIYIVVGKHRIIILAFALMDTHLHFILYGDLDACKRFMHDYVKRTSQYIALRHGEHNKLDNLPINYQTIDTDTYLKTAICYVINNPPVGTTPGPAVPSISVLPACGHRRNGRMSLPGSDLHN